MQTLTTMELPTTLADLANQLQVTVDALRKRLADMDRRLDGDLLKENDLADLVREYATKRGRRSDATVAAAQRLAHVLKVDVDTPPPTTPARPTPAPLKRWNGATRPTPAPAPAASTRQVLTRGPRFWFTLLVYLAATAWQVVNTGDVVLMAHHEASPGLWDANLMDQVYALLFAVSVQFTALLMTLAKGGRSYLAGFAVFEFLINILHFRTWQNPQAGLDLWATHILLSAGIAFTIYSYSELFTQQKDEA